MFQGTHFNMASVYNFFLHTKQYAAIIAADSSKFHQLRKPEIPKLLCVFLRLVHKVLISAILEA